MDELAVHKQKYDVLKGYLDERALRICAAADAKAMGHGGVTFVAKASGLSRTTIYAGKRDLEEGLAEDAQSAPRQERVRSPGGGRKRLTDKDMTLLQDLEKLVAPVTRGDPESALRWTCKSTAKLAAELRELGHEVSQRTVWTLLDELGYSMQSNRKTLEGGKHPDRDAQFQYIAKKVTDFQARQQPVISVDTKKKELVGQFKNAGAEWQPKGEPEKVQVHDFVDKELGRAIPYGVYDVTRNEGWVSVGVTRDTSEFAVGAIRRWWHEMGQHVYPQAEELLITADGGGSNGSRVRLWKVMLQQLADELLMAVHVCHFPPGTSKWNKIEHRMFSHISQNWRGRPLESRAVIVSLIANTRTNTGLHIKADIDETEYLTGRQVADTEMQALSLIREDFHGEWNYRLQPTENADCPG